MIEQDRIALLLSWKHSGFSVHNSVSGGAGGCRRGRAARALRDALAGQPAAVGLRSPNRRSETSAEGGGR